MKLELQSDAQNESFLTGMIKWSKLMRKINNHGVIK